MSVVETLSGLERRINLSVKNADIEKDVEARIKRLSRTAKLPGFRPGKVPVAMLQRNYGPEARFEALNEHVGRAFAEAINKEKLRVAGMPDFAPADEANQVEGEMSFVATFEVYPDVKLNDLSGVEVTRFKTAVSEENIDQTVDILRKQRVNYKEAEGRAAQDDDQVVVDFSGKIDGELFAGGQATDFPFVLGQGRMLPEFEAATKGLKAGESKTFELNFPADYGSAEVAGKTAEFTISVKKVLQAELPAVDSEFAKQLGEPSGDVAKLREDIRVNLERETKQRVDLRTKTSAMDALINVAEFDLPKSLVKDDVQRRVAQAREDLKNRGFKDADKFPIPEETFQAESERRVRLGLIVGELVKEHKLQAKPEQVRAKVESFAQSYEDPTEVVTYYLSNKEMLAEVEAVVLEDNVVDFVLSKAKVNDVDVAFKELMENN